MFDTVFVEAQVAHLGPGEFVHLTNWSLTGTLVIKQGKAVSDSTLM